MKRAPEDKSQWKIVPVAPRPFPEHMKDPQAPAEDAPPSVYAASGYGVLLAMLALGTWWRWGRRNQYPRSRSTRRLSRSPER
jgi:hypothetical protein